MMVYAISDVVVWSLRISISAHLINSYTCRVKLQGCVFHLPLWHVIYCFAHRSNYLNYMSIQVRLVKCTIGNIIVDISFNQTGGICALCFLELVINAFYCVKSYFKHIHCSTSKPFLLFRHLACWMCRLLNIGFHAV